jgi:hypothetical protein
MNSIYRDAKERSKSNNGSRANLSGKTHPSSSGLSHLIPKGCTLDESVKTYCPCIYYLYTVLGEVILRNLNEKI